jgi:hypothetical protein
VFQQQKAERDAKFVELERMFKADEEPLLQALHRVAVTVNSVWDLVNTTDSYVPAIPILAEFLSRPHHIRIREGIVRALTTPEAIGYAADVLKQMEISTSSSPPEVSFRAACASALRVIATKQDIPELERVIADSRHALYASELRTAIKRAKKRRP